MTLLARRILWTLLVPPVVGMLCMIGVLIADISRADEASIWLAPLILCVGIPGGWLLLWGRVVLWRAHRIILTGLLVALLLAGSLGVWAISRSMSGGFVSFAYLGLISVYFIPLLGLTPTLLALFWRPTRSELATPWAGAGQSISPSETIRTVSARSFRMTRTVSRLLLSIGLLPLAILTFPVLMVLAGSVVRDSDPSIAFASLGTLVLAMLYWFLIWMRGVRWTNSRVAGTLIALFVAAGVGVIAGAICGTAVEWSAAVALGSFACGVTWLIGTPMAWCETKSERKNRQQREAHDFGDAIHCVQCGYHMAGLTHARCPECGAEYTLEALLAGNVQRANPDRGLDLGSTSFIQPHQGDQDGIRR